MKNNLAIRVCSVLLTVAFLLAGTAAAETTPDDAASATDRVIELFVALSAIPRGSMKEQKAAAYLSEWATDHGFSSEIDAVGNLRVDAPATAGYEDAPLVVLQGHMDMVQVALDGVDFDFDNDPIRVVMGEKTITADGTTLGADDGIGVAVIQYCMTDPSVTHGPLRAIFTIDEEQTFTGALNVSADWVSDAKYMINVDSEDSTTVTVSSAGGETFFLHKALSPEAPTEVAAYRVSLSGLLGGHSGVEINTGHANAIITVASFLSRLELSGVTVRLASFEGGSASNAIPANASAVFTADGDPETIEKIFGECKADFAYAYGAVETDASFVLEQVETLPDSAFAAADSHSVIALCSVVPNGVFSMSCDYENLVESSSNLGVLSTSSGDCSITLLSRSSNIGRQNSIHYAFELLAQTYGFSFESRSGFSGWSCIPDSRLLSVWEASYRNINGTDCTEFFVHAGLECGVFSALNPDLDIISVGPTLSGVHSPDETLYTDTIASLVGTLGETLAQLAQPE